MGQWTLFLEIWSSPSVLSGQLIGHRDGLTAAETDSRPLGCPLHPIYIYGHGRVRGCATLMVVSEITSESRGWGCDRLCDFDGGFSS